MNDSSFASPVKVVIADPQPLFRDGLRRLLRDEATVSVVGDTPHAAEAVRLVVEQTADVLLLNASMAGALEALAALTATPVKTLALSIHEDRAAALRVLDFVRGVVLKESEPALLFTAIREVADSQHAMRADELHTMFDRRLAPSAVPQPRHFGLTEREMQVLSAVAEGETNVGIAERLKISHKTVKHHLSSIFDKTGVFSRLELALFARHHSLVSEAV